MATESTEEHGKINSNHEGMLIDRAGSSGVIHKDFTEV
jgi:hypothetical protein